jgi:hypothetical protein
VTKTKNQILETYATPPSQNQIPNEKHFKSHGMNAFLQILIYLSSYGMNAYLHGWLSNIRALAYGMNAFFTAG